MGGGADGSSLARILAREGREGRKAGSGATHLPSLQFKDFSKGRAWAIRGAPSAAGRQEGGISEQSKKVT